MSEEKESTEKRDLILSTYLNIVKSQKKLPAYVDFLPEITRENIRYYFGNIETLHAYMRENHLGDIQDHISIQDDIFADKDHIESRFESTRFFITTAVAGAKADEKFLAAIDNYCQRMNAQVCIMPCESVTNSFEKRLATFDKAFNDPKYIFISDNVNLNENLYLCSIQVSAKQIKPITGLTRIGHREGSYIFASPKQFLEHVAVGNSREKSYAIMTPGACTLPSYYSEVFVSKRLSYIAEHDHTIGGIIVELDHDGAFHFRQVQAAEDGSFIDLGNEYRPDGTVGGAEVNAVLGDLHTGNDDYNVVLAFFDNFKHIKFKKIFCHDVFDGYSVNHHIEKNLIEKSVRHMNSKSSLEEELWDCALLLERLNNHCEELVVVKSNHDEFLDRYLEAGRYIYDPVNHYLSLKIAPAMFEGENVLKRALQEVLKSDHFKKAINEITFLSRDDSVQISGVECGAHGDLGLNGTAGSLNVFEKVYGNCVVAHAHSAAIQRGVFRVGTFTKLDMGYNRGPSSWTRTACLVYGNGQRQLVNYINGKFFRND